MPATHFSEELRAIGQALEVRHITAFELKCLAGTYIIQGTSEQPDSSRLKLRKWIRRGRKDASEPMILKPADVEKLSRAGAS